MATVEVTPEVKTEAQLREAIRGEEFQRAEKHYQDLLLVWQGKDLAELEGKMDEKVQEGVKKLFDKWEKEQAPPTKEQIEQLVKQDYIEFTIPLRVVLPDSTVGLSQQDFTISELPQTVERKFYKLFQKRLMDRMPQLNSFVQKQMDKQWEERVTAMLEFVDDGIGIMAELVSMVLDPRGERKLSPVWVADNISSYRQWNIIQAQVQANRLRDFFSEAFRSGQKIQTMTQPLNYQALQRLLQ